MNPIGVNPVGSDLDAAPAEPAAADPGVAEPAAADPEVGAPAADDPEAAAAQVAAALAELDAAADWPPADQVAAYTAAHETLQATLARIDDH